MIDSIPGTVLSLLHVIVSLKSGQWDIFSKWVEIFKFD